jgi:HNH endonuclease
VRDRGSRAEEFVAVLVEAQQLIAQREREISEAQERLRDARRFLVDQLGLLARLPDNERHLFLNTLYWSTAVPVSDLAQAFGMTENALRQQVSPKRLERLHRICGHVLIIEVHSRSGLHDASRPSSGYCTPCLDQGRMQWKREREQREATIRALRSMPYSEYLQTEHWKTLRAGMLRRAQYKCQVCYRSGALQVHHRTYERRGDEDWSDLIVLCGDCHSTFHQQGKLAANA